jgi:hypothetical protein
VGEVNFHIIPTYGGQGSGNFGHSGRAGAVGGSGGGGDKYSEIKDSEFYNFGEKFSNWESNLTEEESGALGSYSESGYSTINKMLRKEVVENKNPSTLLIDSALEKSSLPENVVAFRGFSDPNLISNFENLKGKIYQDKAFVSTTLDRVRAENFAALTGKFEGSGKEGIVAEIRIPAGTKAGYLDVIDKNRSPLGQRGERELLLARGQKFKIIDAVKNPSHYKIVMEVVK